MTPPERTELDPPEPTERRGLAIRATATDPDSPLDGLAVGPARPPIPVDDEVVVPIAAAALNHHDLWTLRGVGAVPVALPRVMGSDGCTGTHLIWPVLACGDVDACRGCADGDALRCRRLTMFGEGRDGTLQPELAVPAANLVPAPRSLTPEQAACLPSAYLTAFSMLFRAPYPALQPGDTVLVTGATGGVGVAAIQLGAAAGLRMVAQVRRMQTAAELEAIGADVVVSTDDDVKAVVGSEVDAVCESVGKATWRTSLRAVRPGGHVLVTGATSGDPQADLRRIFWRRLRLVGVSLGSADDLDALARFVDEHAVVPVVAGTYDVSEAADAFTRLASGTFLGKLVITGFCG